MTFREIILSKRYIKTVNMDVISLGFPEQTIPKWLNGYVYEWVQDGLLRCHMRKVFPRTTYPRKQPFCIRDCTNQAEQPLRLGCELTLRNCLTILSCSYAKICDYIVAQEMPDSLTTMFKIRANCSDFSYRRRQNGLFVDDNAIVMQPKP